MNSISEHFDPQELATVYLHAVDGESFVEIAQRQGVTSEAVRRTMRSVRAKTGSTTTAQACIRVYLSGELAEADRSTPRRRHANRPGPQRRVNYELVRQLLT